MATKIAGVEMYSFPIKEAITTYLAKHSKTSHPYIQDNGFNEAAAKVFANSTKTKFGVQCGVMLTMSDMKEKLKLRESVKEVISTNLTKALIDCAKGKDK